MHASLTRASLPSFISFHSQTRFAARELSTAMFPAFFGAGFAGSVGLPVGTPLSMAGPVVDSTGNHVGGRRALLLSGKEHWLKDPWAPQVDEHPISSGLLPPSVAKFPQQGATAGPGSSPASMTSTGNNKRLVQLLHHLNMSQADEWPLPRCCHPRRSDKQHLCRATGQGSGL
jgi:hypothetical protein